MIKIKQAFRKLARKHHPDVNPGDRRSETKFKEINEAYEVVGDPDKRRKYDDLGANWRLHEQKTQRHDGPFGNQGFGQENPFSRGRWTVNTDELNNEDPFSDFFRTFFGPEALQLKPHGVACRISIKFTIVQVRLLL